LRGPLRFTASVVAGSGLLATNAKRLALASEITVDDGEHAVTAFLLLPLVYTEPLLRLYPIKWPDESRDLWIGVKRDELIERV
jgi:hypothetical protein